MAFASSSSCSGFAAGFLLLAVHVDLDQDIEWTKFGRPLIGQSADYLQSIDAFYPVEMLGNQAGLVGLNRADEVPFQFMAVQLL